jgi:uncharacterized membrane protein YeaQ/YmgE (transglycosylase-associated protein family)
MEILSWILFGFVVGLVARALMPGRDSMGFVGTTVLGIFGAVLGGWFSRVAGLSTTMGFGGLLSATIGAIVLLTAVNAFQKSRKRRVQMSSEQTEPKEREKKAA